MGHSNLRAPVESAYNLILLLEGHFKPFLFPQITEINLCDLYHTKAVVIVVQALDSCQEMLKFCTNATYPELFYWSEKLFYLFCHLHQFNYANH